MLVKLFKLLTEGKGLVVPSYLQYQKLDWFCYVNNLWFQRLLLQLGKVNTSSQFRSYKKERELVQRLQWTDSQESLRQAKPESRVICADRKWQAGESQTSDV